jgi:hypothetical protein
MKIAVKGSSEVELKFTMLAWMRRVVAGMWSAAHH